jgi:2-hydroxychromene-2-carboxylate isomerase
MKNVDIYWSHQSPYCYFSLDRILKLIENDQVNVVLRLVLPGVLRNPEAFYDASETEQRYFDIDTQRTSEFFGIPYGEAQPNPVEFEPGNLFRAAHSQPRIYQLYYLTAAANEMEMGWNFLNVITRLIWDGKNRDWHKASTMKKAVESAGLDYKKLKLLAENHSQIYDQEFADNHSILLEAGHWGVPTYVYNSEPFFGQDRFDQLLWRMGVQVG